jgi:signal transduction histidine kinase
VALLRDDADQIVGISAVMREVTERRNAERELRAKISELESRLGPA